MYLTPSTGLPLVSILLPVFNSARTLGSAIASILAQTYTRWELLLCDDGSTDASLDIARSFARTAHASPIRIFTSPHLGLGAQLNRAIRHARGPYCARMDADDLAYPERLARQVDFLERRRDIDLLCSSIAVFRSGGNLLGVRHTRPTHEELCRAPWASIPMAHPTWMGRTSWFQSHPYRDDVLRMEDRELLHRTFPSSIFAGIPDVLLAYREDSLSLRRQLLARRQTLRHLGRSGPRLRRCLLGVGQACRIAQELGASAAGLQHRLQQRRNTAATTAERTAFEQLYSSLQEHEPLHPLIPRPQGAAR